MRQVPSFLFRLFGVATFLEMGHAIITPILAFLFFSETSPLFSGEVGYVKRSLLFGVCLGLSKLGSLFSNILVGLLSDTFGRKPVFYLGVLGLFFISAGGFLSLIFSSPFILILGIFLGLSLGFFKPNCLAFVTDVTKSDSRITYLSWIQFFFALGAFIAPVLSGYSVHWTFLGFSLPYAMPFFICGVFALITLGLLKSLRDSYDPAPIEKKIILKKNAILFFKMMKNKSIQILLVLLILDQLSWGCFYEFSPVVGKNIFHMSAKGVGFYMSFIALSLMVSASFLIPFIRRYISKKKMISVSIYSMVFGLLTVLYASSYPSFRFSTLIFWLSAIPISFGDVMFFIVLVDYLSQQVTFDQRGKLMGLVYIVAMLAWSSVGFLGGYLTQFAQNGAFFIAPVGSLLLLFWMKLSQRPLRYRRFDF